MARHKKRRKKKDKKFPYFDPPIWIEGFILNEKTDKLEPVKYKLRNRCAPHG